MKVMPIDAIVRWKNWYRKQPANDPVVMEPLKNPVLSEDVMMTLCVNGQIVDEVV